MASITVVASQTTTNTYSNVSTAQALSYPAATTTGNSLFALLAWNSVTVTFTVQNAAATATLTNDAGSGATANSKQAALFRLDNAGSTTGIKMTPSAATSWAVYLLEVSSLLSPGSLDSPTAVGAGGASVSPTITSGVPSNAYDLFLAIAISSQALNPVSSGWTSLGDLAIGTLHVEADYQIVTAAAAQTATWSGTGSSSFSAAIAGYKGVADPYPVGYWGPQQQLTNAIYRMRREMDDDPERLAWGRGLRRHRSGLYLP
jgi:hypothetical protein